MEADAGRMTERGPSWEAELTRHDQRERVRTWQHRPYSRCCMSVGGMNANSVKM